MRVEVQKLPKSTFKLTITVEAEKVKEAHKKAEGEVVSKAQVDGFRKGHAPAELVKEKIDPQKLNSQIMSDLIKETYPQALKDNNLNPIVSPLIEISSFDPEKDFVFTAQTATKPTVEVGDYKKAIVEAHAKKAQGPKEECTDPQHKHEQGFTHFTPTDLIEAIVSVTKVEIPDMIVEDEVNRMLSRLLSQLKPLNLTVESYLKSINKTAQDLKKEYAEMAQKNIAGEMALLELVALEKIEVGDKEIDATVEASGDTSFKESYAKNPMEKAYIKAIIAKNKLIWQLISQVEGEKKEEESDKK